MPKENITKNQHYIPERGCYIISSITRGSFSKYSLMQMKRKSI